IISTVRSTVKRWLASLISLSSVAPGKRGITKYGRRCPFSIYSPVSRISTIFGWLSRARTVHSFSNNSTAAGSKLPHIVFSATKRLVTVSYALNTTPMPPCPIGAAWISYRPPITWEPVIQEWTFSISALATEIGGQEISVGSRRGQNFCLHVGGQLCPLPNGWGSVQKVTSLWRAPTRVPYNCRRDRACSM